jgi:hypothetical protein
VNFARPRLAPHRDLITVAVGTDQRFGELTPVWFDDIELAHNVVHVNKDPGGYRRRRRGRTTIGCSVAARYASR